ncbi:YsnF/AvaK domain-containing protein [Phycisphaerales bacterium AB-hyl4]|uniref:YsnF/AvaK domain-containing protein n=1 Tax=Natronomicrosphaera hydrolytica TaxID=3242702 RepID=A0ABV4UA45_9BACT
MTQHDPIIVVGRGNMRGRIVAEHVGQRPADDRVMVRLDRGGQLSVHPHELRRQADGTYRLGMADEPSSTLAGEPHGERDQQRIELAEERLHVGKRRVEGKVRVHVSVEEREETVDVPLRQDVVRVERVPINREVESPPSVREEEGVLIVPVVEEVVEVNKKLMLREEVRLIREQTQSHQPQEVTLRREQAHVHREDDRGERSPGDGERSASRPEHDH